MQSRDPNFKQPSTHFSVKDVDCAIYAIWANLCHVIKSKTYGDRYIIIANEGKEWAKEFIKAFYSFFYDNANARGKNTTRDKVCAAYSFMLETDQANVKQKFVMK
jgi:hypothetical protein